MYVANFKVIYSIAVKTVHSKPAGGSGGKHKGSPKSLRFILWRTLMSVQNYIAFIYSVFAEICNADQLALPSLPTFSI